MTTGVAGSLAGTLAKGGEAVKAGPVGLVVILLLCVASYFLFRSMSKHLRGVRENFPADETGPATRGVTAPTNTSPSGAGTSGPDATTDAGATVRTTRADMPRADTVPRSPAAGNASDSPAAGNASDSPAAGNASDSPAAGNASGPPAAAGDT